MTVAICINCGEFKHGAFKPCPACSVAPKNKEELALSMALTDHYFGNDDLERFGQAIKDGLTIQLPEEIEEEFEQLLQDIGFHDLMSIANEAETGEPAENKKGGSSLKVELLYLAEEAFEFGHDFVDFGEQVHKMCGTLWSLFRNRFRTLDYHAFVVTAQKLNDRVQLLRQGIDKFAEPSDDHEKMFIGLLKLHIDSLNKATNLTLQKMECMAQLAESPRDGPNWKEWKDIVRDETLLLNECDSSGKALTRYYRSLRARTDNNKNG